MANVIGPDVSFYEDEPSTPQGIDYIKMRQNAEFVIIRAGQNLWVDSDFKVNWAESKNANLPRGSYWFYDSRADPKRQAELWIEQMAGDLGELPLFADLEESYNGPYKGWQKWYDFLERLKTLAPNKEIFIYTAFYYWRDNAPNPDTQPTELEYFHQYPLWIANYSAAQPSIPKPWGANEWTFWQYTENGDGKLYGTETLGVDLNYFNGDRPAFLARFGLPDVPPADQLHVDLNIRATAASTAPSLGILKHDDIVQKLETSADGQWIKILRDDGITGWSLTNYLVAPPDGGGNDIIDMTGKWFRVTATALNMRDGPGPTFNKVGSLQMNEVVAATRALRDLSWIEVRRSDGLLGWCSGTYLANTPPPPPPPVRPIWYKVNAGSLNVREGPGTSFKSIGVLNKDEIIFSKEATPDGSWVNATRFDGLSGWCSAAYLIKLGETAPSQLTQKIFNGVTYYRKEVQAPRKMVTHVLVVDMKLLGMQFLVTPPSQANGTICTRTTSKFLSEFGMRIAINGDGFSYLDPATIPPQEKCVSGDSVKVNGYAASRGVIYSAKVAGQPTVYINQNNVMTFDVPSNKIFNAISGDRTVVVKGRAVASLDNAALEPRTAFGLNSNGRWLMLVVVDGRQPGYSEGITLAELASLLISLDVYSGVNMDGGGSSTMVIESVKGQPFVLNSPIDESTVGKQREVANHLGIFVKK